MTNKKLALICTGILCSYLSTAYGLSSIEFWQRTKNIGIYLASYIPDGPMRILHRLFCFKCMFSQRNQQLFIQALKENNYEEIKKRILRRGIAVNKEYLLGEVPKFQTPVMYAIRAGNVELLKTLLELNADPNLKNSDGNFPLKLTILYRMFVPDKRLLILEQLIQHNVDLKATWTGKENYEKHDALYWAQEHVHQQKNHVYADCEYDDIVKKLEQKFNILQCR